MHTQRTGVCLSFPPLISLLSSGPRWQCKPFNHRLTRTFMHPHTHITRQSVSSNYWFSTNHFSRFCARHKTLAAIRLLCIAEDRHAITLDLGHADCGLEPLFPLEDKLSFADLWLISSQVADSGTSFMHHANKCAQLTAWTPDKSNLVCCLATFFK